ncbi:MAG TPA: GSU2403 family nucleotidyltransferase fold protein [Variovorax sp.]|nr:GSU2403 family nucleotidyltransferase fold protein [Variovorax sp.]
MADEIIENDESQKRQYIDAESVFNELRRVRQQASQVRGGMMWREVSGTKYLIRTSTKGAQKSLGPKSEETHKVYQAFVHRKKAVTERLKTIKTQFDRQRRLNKALRVGRVPNVVANVLNALDDAGLSQHFMVVGTHALCAYESACGVRFVPDAMATRDIDLLFDTRKHLRFFSHMRQIDSSLLGVLRKADKSFERLDDQMETARNSSGFEVDIIRRVAKGDDPHQQILNAPRFSQMVVSTTGDMAMMNTMHPLDFVQVKRMLAARPDRDPLKRNKDEQQARLVTELVAQYMPQYERAGNK